MKRGKGICAAVIVALIVGMTGAVVSASADAGRGDHAAARSAVAVVADASPTAQDGNSGSTRGSGGGSDNGGGAQASQVGSGGGGNGDGTSGAGSSGGGGNPQGGEGGRDGGSSSSSSGSGGSDNGSQRSHPGGGPPSSSGAGGAQGSGAGPGRGNGNGNGNSNGNGNGNGGNGVDGQSGRCSSGCHVGQQPSTPGTVTFTPVPNQTQSSSSPPPTTKPVTTPVTPTPTGKPSNGHPTSTTYSVSATPLPAKHSPTTGLVGLGATVSPAVPAGALTGSRVTTGTPSSIANLLGSAPQIRSSTHSGDRIHSGAPSRTTIVTQPIAQQTIIQNIEQVVPPAIWLALAAALAFGGLSAAWAVHSSHRVRRQAGEFAAMSTAALTDELTGVLNRRGFLDAVERELARARRYERGFVLAYVDVRGLKGVNDTEGHRAGDELLKEAARLLQDSARADDVVGRLGGDEMGLLLVEQGSDGAEAVRSRVASQVPVHREKLGLHSPWDLTIGMAAYPEDGETVDDLLRVADLRLYEQRGIDLIDRAPAVSAPPV